MPNFSACPLLMMLVKSFWNWIGISCGLDFPARISAAISPLSTPNLYYSMLMLAVAPDFNRLASAATTGILASSVMATKAGVAETMILSVGT